MEKTIPLSKVPIENLYDGMNLISATGQHGVGTLRWDDRDPPSVDIKWKNGTLDNGWPHQLNKVMFVIPEEASFE